MPRHCIFNCPRDPLLTLFSFPSDAGDKQRWLDNIRLRRSNNMEMVCSRHFDVDIVRKKRIPRGGTPTLFLGYDGMMKYSKYGALQAGWDADQLLIPKEEEPMHELPLGPELSNPMDISVAQCSHCAVLQERLNEALAEIEQLRAGRSWNNVGTDVKPGENPSLIDVVAATPGGARGLIG